VIADDRPIFQQIAERICADILAGAYPEETQVPSTNEFAAFYRINPATAGKGVNLLVDRGILYKRRGIGMFVAAGARERLLEQRRQEFADRYVAPLVTEAHSLRLPPGDVLDLVRSALGRSEAAAPTRQESTP
jgi:GntR family transcriptional regulator